MLGSIAQLVQSVCLTSRGSGVRLPLLPRKKSTSEFLRCFFCSSGTDFIRFIATCALKRFLRTSLSKFTMSCANRAFLLTRESSPVVESKLHPSRMGFQRSMVIWYQINVLNGTKCTFKATWYRLKRFRGTEPQIATSAVILH